MVTKPKRNQEAYTRSGFLPKLKELNNTNIQSKTVSYVCHKSWIEEKIRNKEGRKSENDLGVRF